MVQLYSEITEGRSLIQHQRQRHCLCGSVPWTVVPAVLTALINLAYRSQKKKKNKAKLIYALKLIEKISYHIDGKYTLVSL